MSPTELCQSQSDMKLPPGQTPHACMKVAQQRDCVRPESLHIVGWHQRKSADMKIPGACAGDFDRAARCICLRSEVERQFLIFICERIKGQCLAVIRSISPDQRNFHRRGRRAAKVNSAGILFSFHQRNSCLPNAMWSGRIEIDARTLIADEWLIFIHYNNLVGTHRMPPVKLHIAESTTSGAAGRRRRFLKRDWKIEFSVVDHLRPQAAIHQQSAMLDKSAVKIL